MCGLVGVIGTNVSVTSYEKLFSNMLVADGVRGLHSTGAIAASGERVTWYKDSVSGAELVSLPEYSEWQRKNTQMKCLLGHNRYATMGAHTVGNAHPFDEGRITLMHNGTLRNWRSLEDASYFDVDSNLIAHLINKNGAEDTMSKLVGAWALAWVDNEEKTLNFCRNVERPLWFAQLRSVYGQKKGIKYWVYGSEKEMLKWLVGRNNMEVCNFFQLKPGKLMTFDLEGDMGQFEITDLKYTAYENSKKATTVVYNKGASTSRQVQYHGHSNTTPFPTSRLVGDVKADDSVSFWPTHYLPLSSKWSQSHGTLWGVLVEEPYCTVRINYISQDKVGDLVWNEQMQAYSIPDGEYSAKAIDVRKEEGQDILILGSSGLKVDFLFSKEGNAADVPQAVALKGYVQEHHEEADVDQSELDELNDDLSFDYVGKVPGPGGVFVGHEAFKDMTKSGCSNCRTGVGIHDCEDITWLNYEDFLCIDCANFLESQGQTLDA